MFGGYLTTIKNLDIFAASNSQLLIPINEIIFWLEIYNLPCSTFKGLWTDFYARPISSK